MGQRYDGWTWDLAPATRGCLQSARSTTRDLPRAQEISRSETFTSKASTSRAVMGVTAVEAAAWAKVARFLSMVFSQSKTAPSRGTERWAAMVVAVAASPAEEAEDCRATAVRYVTLVAAAVRAAMVAEELAAGNTFTFWWRWGNGFFRWR